MVDLKGKTALITGSTSGIGLAMAHAMANEGANIMLNGLLSETDGQELAMQISTTHHIKAGFSNADMADGKKIKSLIEKTHKEFGSLDILINNAGIQSVHKIEDFPEEKWESVIAINLSSSFYTIKYALPLMREQGWGRIINIASVHGLVASIDKAAYVAAKHGLIGLTRVIALETAEENITCNAICPGWTRTELVEPQITAMGEKTGAKNDEEAVRALLAPKQPSKQFVKTDDLAALAVFLCSDVAHQMTGASLPMDGGWTAQ